MVPMNGSTPYYSYSLPRPLTRERERKHTSSLIFLPGFAGSWDTPDAVLKILSLIAWDLEAIGLSAAPKQNREAYRHRTLTK